MSITVRRRWAGCDCFTSTGAEHRHLIIALNVFVIWALTVRGRDVTRV